MTITLVSFCLSFLSRLFISHYSFHIPIYLSCVFCLFFINGNDLFLSGVFGQYSIYNDILFTFAAVQLRNRCAVFDIAYAQCLQYLVYFAYTPRAV